MLAIRLWAWYSEYNERQGIAMKKVWARIGMTLELTEEEFNELQNERFGSSELMQRLASEGRIYPEGEAYTPEDLYGEDEETNYSSDWNFQK